MLDRKINKKVLTAIILAGLGTGTVFNSCSDVSFKASKSSIGGELGNPGDNDPQNPGNPGGPGGPDCGGMPCDELIPMSESLTVQNIARKTDILLVLDNSGSMTAELKELGNRMAGFVAQLDQKNIDWQMCLVLTEGTGETLQWKKSGIGTGKKVLKQSDGDRQNYFNSTISNISPTGTGNEQGIVAMTKAVSRSQNEDCFRDDAALSVIIISDEDEKSCGGTCENHPGSENHSAKRYREQYRDILPEDMPESFVSKVDELWPQKPLTVHSIVIKEDDPVCLATQDKQHPAFYGTFYEALSELTAGTVGSICAPSYADQLTEVGETIEESLASITLKCPPVGNPQIAVTPMPTEPVSYKVEGNKIFFTPALTAGTHVEVNYYCKQ